MKKISLILLSAASVFLFGCGQKPSDPRQLGQAYYETLNCRTCHKIGGEGSAGGPDLTYVGFRKNPQWLTLWLKDPQAWKKDSLMPNFHLSDPTVEALASYLSTLKGQDFSEKTPPWNDAKVKNSPLERGHILFSTVGCVTCHGIGGVGGYPNTNVSGNQIPSLTHVAASYTKEELIQKITNGSIPAKTDPQAPDPLLQMPAWGQVLKPDEIEAVAEYVLSLSPKSPQSF